MDEKIVFPDKDWDEESCVRPKGYFLHCVKITVFSTLKQTSKQWHKKFEQEILSQISNLWIR